MESGVWAGGEFTVSVALDPDDELAAEREESVNDRLLMEVLRFAVEPAECRSDAARLLVSAHVDLHEEMTILVPAGWQCAYAFTIYNPVEEDPETGDQYTVICSGTTTPSWIGEGSDAEEQLFVACARVELEGEAE